MALYQELTCWLPDVLLSRNDFGQVAQCPHTCLLPAV